MFYAPVTIEDEDRPTAELKQFATVEEYRAELDEYAAYLADSYDPDAAYERYLEDGGRFAAQIAAEQDEEDRRCGAWL